MRLIFTTRHFAKVAFFVVEDGRFDRIRRIELSLRRYFSLSSPTVLTFHTLK